jgi:hypothetical protein
MNTAARSSLQERSAERRVRSRMLRRAGRVQQRLSEQLLLVLTNSQYKRIIKKALEHDAAGLFFCGFEYDIRQMRKLVLLLSVSVVMILDYSCKRCTHCVEKDPAGTVQYDYGEYCGKKKDVETFQKDVNALVDPGNTIVCTDSK